MEHDSETSGSHVAVPEPLGSQAAVPEPLAALATVAQRPLTEQVAVFEAVHEHLSARLTDTEG